MVSKLSTLLRPMVALALPRSGLRPAPMLACGLRL